MSADPHTQQHGALRAGKAPVGTGASPLVAQLIALGLVCLGVVGVQALVVSLGAAGGPSWLVSATREVDGVDGTAPWVLAAGIVAVVAGLLLLPIALKRRPRKGVALRADTGVHLRRRDVARLVETTLEGFDTVVTTRVRTRRRTVRLRLTTLAGAEGDDALKESARERVAPVLAALSRPPRVTVHIDHEGS